MSGAKLYETAIALNDLHCPFQDNAAVKAVLDFIKDLSPDIVFLLGDILDFADISHFCRNPLRSLSREEIEEAAAQSKDTGPDYVLQAAMQRELNEAYKFLEGVRKAAPKARIKYVFGNHEYRFYRFLMEKAPELFGLTRAGKDQRHKSVLSVDYLLRFDDLDIDSVFSGMRESYIQWGAYLILGHFNVVRAHSGWTAKALVEQKNISLVQSHTHRMGSFHKTAFNGYQLVGHENGCLCSLEPEYMVSPNWQQGFSVLHKKCGGDRFHIQQVPIVDHKFFYGDVEYGNKAEPKHIPHAHGIIKPAKSRSLDKSLGLKRRK
jgi:predicted MPP superfamily phosphohydrolase